MAEPLYLGYEDDKLREFIEFAKELKAVDLALDAQAELDRREALDELEMEKAHAEAIGFPLWALD